MVGFYLTGTVTLRTSVLRRQRGKWRRCRFHRFFSHAAWDLDVLPMHLAYLVCTIVTLGGHRRCHSGASEQTTIGAFKTSQ